MATIVLDEKNASVTDFGDCSRGLLDGTAQHVRLHVWDFNVKNCFEI
jgi:hypothetical protein